MHVEGARHTCGRFSACVKQVMQHCWQLLGVQWACGEAACSSAMWISWPELPVCMCHPGQWAHQGAGVCSLLCRCVYEPVRQLWPRPAPPPPALVLNLPGVLIPPCVQMPATRPPVVYANRNTSVQQVMYQAVEACKQTFKKAPQVIFVMMPTKVRTPNMHTLFMHSNVAVCVCMPPARQHWCVHVIVVRGYRLWASPEHLRKPASL